mmetsp:Transcript_10210/g.30845  ORF Transcript_10210/g.30845 Transcript_10210/m.30845 type:complete len:123 (+) Transcript_10210:246-614(+)|eukprot:CAMPEP_0198645376 /NCGR_PEP_ID=MMETSP1467-20131203/1219_1 /TAXON_ID=1462469 /ORGANISM="unid. sp., Strain CCMP2135" /LENGTH=122 /DNA_ID=CAMNT_0044380867 /DNA_START=129 /DNA_END=497 /DNA_ORIENTATION=-
MTTDVKAKIEGLEEEQKELKVEIKQVKAALAGREADAGDYVEYAKLAFVERKIYLEKRLSELTAALTAKENGLTELRKKENLVLEKRRAARAPKASRQRSCHPFGPSRRGEWRELPLSPIVE